MSHSDGFSDYEDDGYQFANGSTPAELPEQHLPPPVESKSFLDPIGEHAKILNVLDRLRELGVDQGSGGHSLPQIIVCGSQSSGKSSVLEAIAGIPFPRKEGICTKYKTQVTLLRKPEVLVQLGIIPDPVRPPAEKTTLSNFKRSLDRKYWRQAMVPLMDQVHDIIFNPKESKGKKQWTSDTLTITISGPNELDLQLLDLPGLIELDKWEDGNVEMVRTMVQNEMVKSHSIVLAVAKATDDIENHKILRMCKTLRVSSGRIIAVLTMPDEAGGKATECVRMVQGQDIDFKKTFPFQWHVLVNRNEEELAGCTTQDDRDEKERRFFEENIPWNELDKKDTGIAQLRYRLGVLLFAVAKKELPKLRARFEQREQKLKKDLERLGGDLSDEQLAASMKKCLEKLKKMSRDHGRGYYESDIRSYDGPHPIHLRARVVDQSEDFRDKLLKFGQMWELEGRVPEVDPNSDLRSVFRAQQNDIKPEVPMKSIDEGVKDLARLLDSMRKTGLPGFDNEEVINKAFWLLTDTWEPIATQHINNVFDCCRNYFETATVAAFSKRAKSSKHNEGFGNNAVVAERYLNKHLMLALEKRKLKAFAELENLEEDRLATCQNFDKEFMKKYRAQRVARTSKRFVNGVENTEELDDKDELRPEDIAKMQELLTPEQWTIETARNLLDAMWTHYEIVCRQFVANVLMQTVERHLLRVIEEIVEDDLALDEMKELVKAEELVEAQKEIIQKEMNMISQARAVLYPSLRKGKPGA